MEGIQQCLSNFALNSDFLMHLFYHHLVIIIMSIQFYYCGCSYDRRKQVVNPDKLNVQKIKISKMIVQGKTIFVLFFLQIHYFFL